MGPKAKSAKNFESSCGARIRRNPFERHRCQRGSRDAGSTGPYQISRQEGRGEEYREPPQWIPELIAAQDRRLAAPTFSAEGLYLFGVRYDARWNLPGFPPMMPFDLESWR